jgi:hypothetical protein
MKHPLLGILALAAGALVFPGLVGGAEKKPDAELDELYRQRAAVEAERARTLAEQQRVDASLKENAARLAAKRQELDAATAEVAEAEVIAEEKRRHLNMEGLTREQIVAAQDEAISRAARRALLPRAAAPIRFFDYLGSNPITFDAFPGKVVVLVLGRTDDPLLSFHLRMIRNFREIAGVHSFYVMLDADGVKNGTLGDIVTTGGRLVIKPELNAFLQQDRVYSGTYVVVDEQRRVRYQGPFHDTKMFAPILADQRARNGQ